MKGLAVVEGRESDNHLKNGDNSVVLGHKKPKIAEVVEKRMKREYLREKFKSL